MKSIDHLPESEAQHFILCPACETYFDRRDPTQVFSHIHDETSLRTIAQHLGIDTEEPEEEH